MQLIKASRLLMVAVMMTLLLAGTIPHTASASPRASDQSKVFIRHYGLSGHIAGFHHIDLDTYDAIIDAIIGVGGLATPENIDLVYHGR